MFKNLREGIQKDIKESKEKHPKIWKAVDTTVKIGAGAVIALGAIAGIDYYNDKKSDNYIDAAPDSYRISDADSNDSEDEQAS